MERHNDDAVDMLSARVSTLKSVRLSWPFRFLATCLLMPMLAVADH